MNRVSFNDTSSMSSQRSSGESAVLFYSNRCPHSQMILKTLDSTNLSGSIRKICVDFPGVKIPSVVQSVPTLIARGVNRPIVGGEIGQWIQQQGRAQASMAARPTQAPMNQVAPTGMNGRTTAMSQGAPAAPSSVSGALQMDTGGLGCYNDLDDCYSTVDGVDTPVRSNVRYTSLMDDASFASTAPSQGPAAFGDRGHVDRKAQERKMEADQQLERIKNERMQQNAGFHQRNPLVPSGYKATAIPPTFRNTIKSI